MLTFITCVFEYHVFSYISVWIRVVGRVLTVYYGWMTGGSLRVI